MLGMAMRLLNIAALQVAPVKGDPEATLKDFEVRVQKLRQSLNELQLIVVPELHLAAVGGFFDDQAGDAERLPTACALSRGRMRFGLCRGPCMSEPKTVESTTPPW